MQLVRHTCSLSGAQVACQARMQLVGRTGSLFHSLNDVPHPNSHLLSGGLLQGLNEDSLAVQNAISEKLGAFIHHVTTFLTGYLIAFERGWVSRQAGCA